MDEGETKGTFGKHAMVESAMGDKTSVLNVSTSNAFDNQFSSHYNCRVFPWALNYDCGGPDYPDLFSDWSWLERALSQRECSGEVGELRERWRRAQGEAPFLPVDYVKMLACLPETQIAGDWMRVPAARNLHWRYAVLHSAFLVCKQCRQERVCTRT